MSLNIASRKRQAISRLSQIARSRGERKPSLHTDRQVQMRRLAQKEQTVSRLLGTEAGLRRLGANMANPVRKRLDYKGIFRKFTVVEQIPDGVPMFYDKDFPEATAIKIGRGGSARIIEMVGERVTLEEFEIVTRPKIPYRELYVRRFRALDRTNDRLTEGMQLREDLLGFGLLETAANLAGGNTPQVTPGTLDRTILAKAFAQVEQRRLQVGGVLMSAFGTMGIRRWDWQNLDQVAMQEVRETGYLGDMWGAQFYVSDQIPAGVVYILTTPKFLSWMPIRKETEVIPADDPDNVRLGFVGYELLGMTVHNSWGVCKLTFDPTA